MAKPKDIDKVFASARKAFGKLDVFIDNAGLGAEGIIEMEEG